MKTTTIILITLIFFNINLKAQIIPTGDPNITNILRKIKVDANDRYAIAEAYKIKLEANKWLNNTKQLNANLEQLMKIKDMASKFEEIRIKTEKSIESTQNEIIDKKLDALESFELSNDIIFAFFKNHKDIIIPKSNKECVANFDRLIKESNIKWIKAKTLRKRGYEASTDKIQLELLVSAQILEEETITEIEKVISNFYLLTYASNKTTNYDLFFYNSQNNNLTINRKSYNETDFVIAEVKPQITNNTKLDTVIEKTNNNIVDETPHKICYKIQVGAFLKQADESAFRGINPIVTEKNQEGFTRYLAGEYNSNDVAAQALKILKDTGFSDAFMVTYEKGIRTQSQPQNKTNSNLAKK